MKCKGSLLGVATVTSHADEQLAKLNGEVILVGLEFPANLLSGWAGQLLSKLFQSGGDRFVLREDGAQVGQGGRNLRPDTRKVSNHIKAENAVLQLTGSSARS